MANKLFCKIFQGVYAVVNQIIPHRQPVLVKGRGCSSLIPELLSDHDVKRPMIVTGPRVGKSPLVASLLETMPQAYLFSEVLSDPPASQIMKMAELYKQHQCDGIVAIGGGSNMDAAKAMGAMVVRPRKSVQELDGVLKVRRKLPFFVAVPTTAGTGSECTIAAVVTDDMIGRKYAIADFALCPDVAVLDPDLTASLPAALTAYTGMDALTHAVETYLNAIFHLRDTKSLAESAIRDIFTYLPRAYADGNDMEAREKMLQASYNAGIAFTVAGVGYVHSIAHAFGGQYHIQHGLANAVILPHVLEAYRPKADQAYARLADVLRLDCQGGDKASAFIEAIRQLNRQLDIPEKFNVLEESNVEKMAAWADKDAHPLYPCPVFFKKEDFARIMRIVG